MSRVRSIKARRVPIGTARITSPHWPSLRPSLEARAAVVRERAERVRAMLEACIRAAEALCID
jgi:hypothetical protein